MKLKKIELHSFRHFKNQSLNIDPKVTVLVGKNDTGKTSILFRLLTQYLPGLGAWSIDVPRLPSVKEKEIKVDFIWKMEKEDFKAFSFKDIFGKDNFKEMKICLRHFEEGQQKRFSVYVDNKEVYVYELSAEGKPILKPGFYSFLRDFMPEVQYVNLSDSLILKGMFTGTYTFKARFYEPTPQAFQFRRYLLETRLEIVKLMLELEGLKAECWELKNEDEEKSEPWPGYGRNVANLSIREIEVHLKKISEKITKLLQKWWDDPPGLRFKIIIPGKQHYYYKHTKSNIYQIMITDKDGLPHSSFGLWWFLTFLIIFLDSEQRKKQILVFDEPAYNLHPKAQKAVCKIFNEISKKHQIIYSTHSPFLIDWNFPQRIRVLERDYETKLTQIKNKPYHAEKSFMSVWDPLRNSIDISLGDLGFLGEKNLFVEGISDQVYLANISAFLEEKGKSHLNLHEINIIPYSNEETLELLIRVTRSLRRKAVILYDSDEGGRKANEIAQKNNIPHLGIKNVITQPDASKEYSIEDLIGTEEYLRFVNDYYGIELKLSWFKEIKPEDLDKKTNSKLTLGKRLEEYFKDEFEEKFSKSGVAIYFSNSLEGNESTPSCLNSFEKLFQEINAKFKNEIYH